MCNFSTRELNRARAWLWPWHQVAQSGSIPTIKFVLSSKPVTLLLLGNAPGAISSDLCLGRTWDSVGPAWNCASSCPVNWTRWKVKLQHFCGGLALFNLSVLWFCVPCTELIDRMQLSSAVTGFAVPFAEPGRGFFPKLWSKGNLWLLNRLHTLGWAV